MTLGNMRGIGVRSIIVSCTRIAESSSAEPRRLWVDT